MAKGGGGIAQGGQQLAAGGSAPLGSLTADEQNKLTGYNMSIAMQQSGGRPGNTRQVQELYALRQPLMEKLRSGGGGGAPPPGFYSGGKTALGMPAGGYGPQGGGGNDAYDYYRNQLASMLAGGGGGDLISGQSHRMSYGGADRTGYSTSGRSGGNYATPGGTRSSARMGGGGLY